MKADELYDLVQKGFDRLENRLIAIENRLSEVEKYIAKSKGKTSGGQEKQSAILVTAKDIFVMLCGIAAVVISFIRLTQN